MRYQAAPLPDVGGAYAGTLGPASFAVTGMNPVTSVLSPHCGAGWPALGAVTIS
jgi:hypothetical protein